MPLPPKRPPSVPPEAGPSVPPKGGPREPTPELEASRPLEHHVDRTMEAEPVADDTTMRLARLPGTETGLAVGRSDTGRRPPVPERASVPPRPGSISPPRPDKVDRVVVKLKRVGPIRVPLPAYQTDLAAGMDLVAAIDAPLTIAPLARVLVPTGISIALPAGYEAQIRPRSGLAWSRGLTILNAPGTVDADYRGEIKVLLVNLGTDAAEVHPGERIAQMVVARHARVELVVVDALDETKRGAGGYGSTGV